MSDFETEYRKWRDMHLGKRKGERLRMLKDQHGYGEKLLLEQVWWPVMGNFDFLHPEYEILDEDRNYYYVDYAYVRFPKPTALESDGFNPHAREADRHSFKKGRRRQNAIALGDWNILRFSTDDLKEDPEHCRKTVRRMLERWYGEERKEWSSLPMRHRELLMLASKSIQPFTPLDSAMHLKVSVRTVRNLLHHLVEQGYLEAASGTQRIHSYQLAERKESGTKFRSDRWQSPAFFGDLFARHFQWLYEVS